MARRVSRSGATVLPKPTGNSGGSVACAITLGLPSPQTVLKTAGLPSTRVRRGPLRFDHPHSHSRIVRHCPPPSVKLAVILAVSDVPGDS